jgi:hypothetical protein
MAHILGFPIDSGSFLAGRPGSKFLGAAKVFSYWFANRNWFGDDIVLSVT